MKQKLNVTSVRQLIKEGPEAGEKDFLVFDTETTGFGLRVFESGKATFFVRYLVGKQQRRISLGLAIADKDVIKEARNAAIKIISDAKTKGVDAQVQRQAERTKAKDRFGGLIQDYLDARRGAVSETYWSDTQRYLKRHWAPLHSYGVDAISRRDVVRVLDDIAKANGKVAADRARAALSGFFAWALERDYVQATPLLGVKAHANGGGRERVLSELELAAVWHASRDMGDYGDIIRLLILTGQRRSEIADLQWSETDFAKTQIELPGTRTKNKRPHVIPLSTRALGVLAGVPERVGRDYVFGEGSKGFQGWGKSKFILGTKLRADMPPWTLHDIRRSVITHLNENGIADPHVIEAVANHVSGHKASVAGIYNRSAYAKQKRAALETWGKHVTDLVTQ